VACIELTLPLPTSANDLWTPTRKGLRKSDAYRAWLKEAGWLAMAQRQRKVSGPYKISISAVRPDNRRRDLGNLLKATEDLLVGIGLIDDDSKSEMIVMRWVTAGDGITVRVEPAGVE
jgi:Holliday junction resolvase RusA-like endonuclease